MEIDMAAIAWTFNFVVICLRAFDAFDFKHSDTQRSYRPFLADFTITHCAWPAI